MFQLRCKGSLIVMRMVSICLTTLDDGNAMPPFLGMRPCKHCLYCVVALGLQLLDMHALSDVLSKCAQSPSA